VHGDLFAPLVEAARRSGAEVHEVTSDVLDAVSPVRTPTGIVALATWAPLPIETAFSNVAGVMLGLVDVQDPGNAGTIIRTADALGAAGILTLDGTADPSGWKCVRGAMGSTFRVTIARGASTDALTAARRAGMPIIATVADGGTPIDRVDFRRAALVLLGNEGAGLSSEVIDQADDRVTIPMRAGANSLNVATTAAIVLWHARR
jgi:TrmH family RNA methyltransferase